MHLTFMNLLSATAKEMLQNPWVRDIVIGDEEPKHVHRGFGKSSSSIPSIAENDAYLAEMDTAVDGSGASDMSSEKSPSSNSSSGSSSTTSSLSKKVDVMDADDIDGMDREDLMTDSELESPSQTSYTKSFLK
jgi:hypothetical protein